MEEKPVKPAFGSPGGKTYLAPKIVDMIPPHKTYVEPFAGGAAVFFRKPPSESLSPRTSLREVLGDKDTEIAFAFKFLRDMTPEQFERLKRYDWVISRGRFTKVKAMAPRDDVERFRKFYYMKRGSFRKAGLHVNIGDLGKLIRISHLPRVAERLKRVGVHTSDAVSVVKQYDSPSTFFYLDPPYLGKADVGGTAGKYTAVDLKRLCGALEQAHGKFTMSLAHENLGLMPINEWKVRRVLVQRKMTHNGRVDKPEYEILVSNYKLDKVRRQRHHRRYRPPTKALAGMRG